jgi:hypothetical protein
MTSSKLHHLCHPQVFHFSPWKQNALEPPSHLPSLQRNHYNTWKVKELKPTIPFQWQRLLQPCSKPIVLDLRLPKKLTIRMNSPQPLSGTPKACKKFIAIQVWVHLSTSWIHLSPKIHMQSTKLISNIFTYANLDYFHFKEPCIHCPTVKSYYC